MFLKKSEIEIEYVQVEDTISQKKTYHCCESGKLSQNNVNYFH